MTLIDTGYLVALLDERDALHPRVTAWARVLGPGLVVTEYVLWELLNFFSSHRRRGRSDALVDDLYEDPSYMIVEASHDLWIASRDLHRRVHDKDWSLTDCASFVTMKRLGIRQALTHDIHFEQAGFEPLLRQEPPQQGNP
jgi:uncharacterized protein